MNIRKITKKLNPQSKIKNSVTEYKIQITPEPLDVYKSPTTKEDHDLLIHDYYHRCIEGDKSVEAPMLKLLERYPDEPKIRNFLAVLYEVTGKKNKYKQIILENYRLFPDYLFAKIQYCEYLNEKGNRTAFIDVFGDVRHIQQVYPHRDKFHYSEIIAFSFTLSKYLIEIREFDQFEMHRDIMHKLAPEDPRTQLIDGLYQKIQVLMMRNFFQHLNSKD